MVREGPEGTERVQEGLGGSHYSNFSPFFIFVIFEHMLTKFSTSSPLEMFSSFKPQYSLNYEYSFKYQ